MPRRPTRRVPTIIVPGIDGSGVDHWQSWLGAELRATGRVTVVPELPELDEPDLSSWLQALHATMDDFGEDGFDVVAHSLGALLWLHHCASAAEHPRPARVALVALPAAHCVPAVAESFVPVPLNIDNVRQAAEGTVLVGSDNDPFCPGGIARVYGTPLKMAATVIPGAAHLNPASGHGPWPAMLDWCGRDNLAFIG